MRTVTSGAFYVPRTTILTNLTLPDTDGLLLIGQMITGCSAVVEAPYVGGGHAAVEVLQATVGSEVGEVAVVLRHLFRRKKVNLIFVNALLHYPQFKVQSFIYLTFLINSNVDYISLKMT